MGLPRTAWNQRQKAHCWRGPSARYPKELIVFDTETDTTAPFIGNKQLQKLTVGWATSWNLVSGKRSWFQFNEPKEFHEWLLKRYQASSKEGLWVFGHNVEYDLLSLGTLNFFAKANWRLQFLHSKNMSSIFILTNEHEETRNTKSIRFLSTTNYVAVSLAEIGEQFGLAKGKPDFETASIDEISRYCHRDVEIVFLMVEKILKWCLETNTGFAMTVGSLSMNHYLRNFYHWRTNPVFVHNLLAATALERAAFAGGITMVFSTAGHEGCYPLDVNGLYGFIQEKTNVPYKLLRHVERHGHNLNDELFRLLKTTGQGVIAKVKIALDEDHAYILAPLKLPNNQKPKCFWYGINTVSLCQPELEWLLQNNQKIIKTYEYAVYLMRDQFAEAAMECNRGKDEASKNKDEFMRKWYKNLNVNRFGKTGQRYVEKIKLQDEYDDGFIKFQRYQEKTTVEEIVFGFGKQRFIQRQTMENAANSFPAIAAFITSNARIKMIRAIQTIGSEHLFYIDTDSLFVDKIGYQRLFQSGMIDQHRSGFFKDETLKYIKHGQPFFQAYDSKNYICGKIRKLKGVPKKASLLHRDQDGETWEYQIPIKLNTRLKKGIDEDGALWQRFKKTTKLTYDKGIVHPNGRVVPFYVIDGKIKKRR